MVSQSQTFPKRHPCSGEETSKTLDLSARWLCSHPLPWRLSNNKFIPFGRNRDETVVLYSVTATLNTNLQRKFSPPPLHLQLQREQRHWGVHKGEIGLLHHCHLIT